MEKITIETLYRDDKQNYPKYRYISRQVAKRLCQELPQMGYEKVIGNVGKDEVILQNISGCFRVWVYYPVC